MENENLDIAPIPQAETEEKQTKRIITLPQSITISLEGLLWVVLGMTSVFLRLWMLGARVMSHDESLHVFYSWTLSEGRGFTHTPMMHGPFLFEASALLQAIFGANDFTSRLLPAIIGSAVVIVIPLLLRPWVGRIGALSTGLFLSVSPYILYYSRYNRHDILVIAWALLAFFAVLSYERNRKERDLVILSISLALMFASMEITFIYVAIFVVFLTIALFARSGLKWKVIRQSAEFDLLIVLVTLGAFFSSPIAILGLNPIWQAAGGKPFVDLAVLGSFGMEWAGSEYGVRLWVLLGVFSLAAIALGWWWGKMRWVKLAGIFLTITLVLFSTFLTNPAGLGTGLIGSLGYWLSQQAVQR
ncbi:TIGR03663 family protein, partial [bacterium]